MGVATQLIRSLGGINLHLHKEGKVRPIDRDVYPICLAAKWPFFCHNRNALAAPNDGRAATNCAMRK
jgi:hypothetical protein